MSTDLVPIDIASSPALAIPIAPASDLIAAWLAGKKPTTVRGYSEDLASFARWLGASSPGVAVDDLLRQVPGDANGLVLRWSSWMLAQGLASATINRRLAALRSVTKLARLLGRIAWTIEVEGPKAEARRDMRGPDHDEMKHLNRLLKKLGGSAIGRRDRAIVSMLYGLGLRRAEVVELDLADLDFVKNTVAVRRKGKREKQVKEMPGAVARAASEWVVARGGHDGPLFHRLDGAKGLGRLNPKAINVLVGRVGRAAKLPRHVRPHGLRHAAISELARKDKTVLEIMDFSDHAKPETVMRYLDKRGERGAAMAREVARGLD